VGTQYQMTMRIDRARPPPKAFYKSLITTYLRQATEEKGSGFGVALDNLCILGIYKLPIYTVLAGASPAPYQLGLTWLAKFKSRSFMLHAVD
jgi:hypothetical protein